MPRELDAPAVAFLRSCATDIRLCACERRKAYMRARAGLCKLRKNVYTNAAWQKKKGWALIREQSEGTHVAEAHTHTHTPLRIAPERRKFSGREIDDPIMRGAHNPRDTTCNKATPFLFILLRIPSRKAREEALFTHTLTTLRYFTWRNASYSVSEWDCEDTCLTEPVAEIVGEIFFRRDELRQNSEGLII